MIATTPDPFADIEQMARRQAAEKDAERVIAKARVQLVLGKDAACAFFATLALRLRAEPSWKIDTMATDGRRLLYNPDFTVKLSPAEAMGVVCHEVMHNAYTHGCRRMGRKHKPWNVAADLSINGIIRSAGMKLPFGALFPGEGQFASFPPDLSAEEYYDRLPKWQGDGDEPDEYGDEGGCGGVIDPADPAERREIESEARINVAQAHEAAKARGTLPGCLGRLVDEIVEPKVSWQDQLREFVSRTLTAKDDYAWNMPNRRYIAQGLYLPSLRSEVIGDLVIAIDTSGSCSSWLKDFAGEMQGILEAKPCSVVVIYCDCRINKVEHWEPSDGELVFQSVGGGGTSHVPCWEYIRDNGIDPTAIVCLTDGETNFGDDPGIPVLWAITPGGASSVPFGRIIQLK